LNHHDLDVVEALSGASLCISAQIVAFMRECRIAGNPSLKLDTTSAISINWISKIALKSSQALQEFEERGVFSMMFFRFIMSGFNFFDS